MPNLAVLPGKVLSVITGSDAEYTKKEKKENGLFMPEGEIGESFKVVELDPGDGGHLEGFYEVKMGEWYLMHWTYSNKHIRAFGQAYVT